MPAKSQSRKKTTETPRCNKNKQSKTADTICYNSDTDSASSAKGEYRHDVRTDEHTGDGSARSTQITLPEMVDINKTDKQDKLQRIESQLENLSLQLSKVASKVNQMTTTEYLDNKIKALVDTDFLKESLERIENQIKRKISDEVKELKVSIKALEGDLFLIQTNASKMEESIERIKDKQKKHREEMSDINYSNKSLKLELNDLQQYTRKNSVIIYGILDGKAVESVEECTNNVLKVLNNNLEMNMDRNEISISHRLGIFQENGNRPIICKFISRNRKIETIQRRKQLRGTRIVIREDLTKMNQELLKKVAEMEVVNQTWTMDTKIKAKLLNGRIVNVNHHTDLAKLETMAYGRRPDNNRDRFNSSAE